MLFEFRSCGEAQIAVWTLQNVGHPTPPWGLPPGKHRNVMPGASGLGNSDAHASDFFLFNPTGPRVSEDDDSPNLAFDVDSYRVVAEFQETLFGPSSRSNR